MRKLWKLGQDLFEVEHRVELGKNILDEIGCIV